jgi:hypothetical protein
MIAVTVPAHIRCSVAGYEFGHQHLGVCCGALLYCNNNSFSLIGIRHDGLEGPVWIPGIIAISNPLAVREEHLKLLGWGG